jgi:hypothetical protein
MEFTLGIRCFQLILTSFIVVRLIVELTFRVDDISSCIYQFTLALNDIHARIVQDRSGDFCDQVDVHGQQLDRYQVPPKAPNAFSL